MKTQSIIFAFAMFLLLTASALTAIAEPVVKPITIEWVEKGAGGKVYTETFYCAADCETLIAERVEEIESSGGLIIEVREGKE